MKQTRGNPNPIKRKPREPHGRTVDGRFVYIKSGAETRTINICSVENQESLYESRIRIPKDGTSSKDVKEKVKVASAKSTVAELQSLLQGPPWDGDLEFTDYAAWSAYWKSLREFVDVNKAFRQWKAPKPDPKKWLRLEKKYDWKRSLYKFEARKEAEKNGTENKIERLLFSGENDENRTEGKRIYIQLKGRTIGSFTASYHQPRLTNQRKEQRIADAAGVLESKGKRRALMIEVKAKTCAGDCWFALIESLQQVVMARAYESSDLKKLCPGIDVIKAGAWGIVLAPKSYFEKQENSDLMNACKDLMRKLGKKRSGENDEGAQARIAFATSDRLEKEGIIEILPDCHNWRLE